MDINTRIERENDRPVFIRWFLWIFDFLPPPNTIRGIFAYTFVIYLLTLLFGLISYRNSNKKEDPEQKEKEKREINKKLEVSRKIRSEEANKLLDKITKVY